MNRTKTETTKAGGGVQVTPPPPSTDEDFVRLQGWRARSSGFYPLLPLSRPAFASRDASAAVVHVELDRMSRHAEARDFLCLQSDVSIDHVVGEHATAGQELAVLVEVLEGHVERMTHRRDVLRFFRLEVVQILVGRFARMDLVLNAVEAGHHHGGKREVRIRGRVRETHFDAARL